MIMADRQQEQSERVVLGPLQENLPFLTRALRAYIRAENAEFYADLGAEHGEIATLCLIGLNAGISQNDLAAKLVFKKSAITKLVKDLERRGLIKRSKVKSDRRWNALELTAAGQERYRKISRHMSLQNDLFLEPFTDEERKALFRYLNRLYSHLGDRQARRTGSSAAISEAGDD
jgi:DNA-binding MarR family transcriptional regulator